MSGFLSPKFLKYRGVKITASSTIEVDQPCRGCEYNLRGLQDRGRCPECGLAIGVGGEKVRSDRAAVLVPNEPGARAMMTTGFRLGAFSLALLGGLRFWLLLPLPHPALGTADLAAVAISCLWIVAVVLMLPGRFNIYGRPMRITRLVLIASQLLWPVAFLAIWWHDQNGTPDSLRLVWLLGRILAGAGLLGVLWMLSVAAWDADRDDLATLLVRSAWGMGFASLLVGVLPRGIAPEGMGWVIYGLISVFIFIWAGFVGMGVYALYSMGGNTAWISRDQRDDPDRQERINATRAELQREADSKVRPLGE